MRLGKSLHQRGETPVFITLTNNCYNFSMSSEGAEKKLANLIPYKPGQSGNPKGRKKGSLTLTEILRKILRDKVNIKTPDGKEIKVTKGELLMLKWTQSAMEGEIGEISKIIERMEGKPVQPVQVTRDVDSETVKELRDLANTMKAAVPKTDGSTVTTPTADSTEISQ